MKWIYVSISLFHLSMIFAIKLFHTRLGTGVSDEPIFQHVCGEDDSLIDVVFVHGLTGDPKETWCSDGSGEFWPEWIAADLSGLSIFTLGYPASLFDKQPNKEMDMFERAGNVLELMTGKELGTRPIVFVTHSLGGILAKMILRKSCDASDEDWKLISQSTRLVIFLSTPHTGAALADALTLLPCTSNHVKLLANQFGVLEDLNDQYRTLASGRSDLETAVYYEKHATKKLTIVSRESADPGVAGAQPVAVDKDHVTICKPLHRDDVVYLGVKRRIKNILKLAQDEYYNNGSYFSDEDYGCRSDRDRRDLHQKLIDAGREHEYDYAN